MSTETMTTTAPSTDASRLTDEDTLYEDVEDAIARVVWNCGYGCVSHSETAQQAATEALAAAEPALRARHRAELWAELIAMYEGDAEGFGERASGMSVRLPALISGLKRLAEKDAKAEADATRPVEGRGDR